MLAVLVVILPIFALILAGWLVRRTGVMGPNATGELNRFVVWLALPALLFDIVAGAKLSEIWQPGFLAAYGLGTLAIFAVPLLIRMFRPRPLADTALDSLNAAYPNTGYMGFPLAAAALGPAALAPTLLASIITVCGVFALTLVLVEVDLQAEKRPLKMIGKVALSLAKNPLLVAPALGAVFLLGGIEIPAPAETFLKLLGGAASPCALVGLGLFLGEKRTGARPPLGNISLLVGLKLIAQPVVTWILAAFVFGLPAPLTWVAVLMAALPTGTGPFMVAEFYKREAGVTSAVILASTVLSLVTIAAYLSWVG